MVKVSLPREGRSFPKLINNQGKIKFIIVMTAKNGEI